jgi:hypothetical protein
MVVDVAHVSGTKLPGRETATTPVGVLCFFISPQGSRETRQPWALCRNRFAVLLHRIPDLIRNS